MPELTLLCVHAHPDDEAIATGGVLARYAEEGIRTAVVTCTGGERGEVVGPGMDPEEVTPHLGALRYEELAHSLEILKSGPPRLLGYIDSGMTGTDGNGDPASFWLAPFDQAVGRMVAQIRELRPHVLVTYDAFGLYGHPDHIQAHRVASAAIEAAEVAALYPEAGPAWRVPKVYYATVPKSGIARFNAWFAERGIPSPFGEIVRPEDLPFGTPDEQVTTVVDVLPWLGRKRDALRAHVSQIGRDSFFFTSPDEFFARERFARQRSDVPVPAREDDLFAGLRG